VTLIRCSLVGIDSSTGFDDIHRLLNEYPFAEFGISYSRRAGDAGATCYASMDYVDAVAKEFSGNERIALHICYGEATREFLSGTGRTSALAAHFPRIQINFSHEHLYRDYDLPLIRKAFAIYPRNTIITTHNPDNADLWQHLAGLANHEVLFDASAGRGLTPGRWPAPLPGVRCGYAGGLGPETIAMELPLIEQAAEGKPYWIDMESRLRAGARDFPVDRARRVLEIVAGLI
jgi:hypothetical protein